MWHVQYEHVHYEASRLKDARVYLYRLKRAAPRCLQVRLPVRLPVRAADGLATSPPPPQPESSCSRTLFQTTNANATSTYTQGHSPEGQAETMLHCGNPITPHSGAPARPSMRAPRPAPSLPPTLRNQRDPHPYNRGFACRSWAESRKSTMETVS